MYVHQAIYNIAYTHIPCVAGEDGGGVAAAVVVARVGGGVVVDVDEPPSLHPDPDPDPPIVYMYSVYCVYTVSCCH